VGRSLTGHPRADERSPALGLCQFTHRSYSDSGAGRGPRDLSAIRPHDFLRSLARITCHGAAAWPTFLSITC
jgi:hypothetical protein